MVKVKMDIEKQNKGKPSASSQLVPKKVLIHGKGGSFYAVRYVRQGEGEVKDESGVGNWKKVDESKLVKLIDDGSISQHDLHEMVNVNNTTIRQHVVYKINQSGLFKMINDKSEFIRNEVAQEINLKGLHKMLNDKSEKVVNTASKRIELIDKIESTINSYEDNKEIVLSDYMKDELNNIMKEGKSSEYMMKCIDEFYNNIDNTEISNFHITSRNSWIHSSSSKLALLLKDSIKRQFGGEIRHHDAIDDYDKEANDLYKTYNKKDVDEYVKIQKNFTRKCLDQMFPDTDIITLYRGTNIDETQSLDDDDSKIIVKSNPLSSWTLEKDIANSFGDGVILSTKVYKDDIWSTFMSHAYDGIEREILLMGNKDREVTVI